MKTDVTGSQIKGAPQPAIQPSKSQTNSLAFIDSDNHWVHIDRKLVESLYRFAASQESAKAVAAVGATKTGASNSLEFKM